MKSAARGTSALAGVARRREAPRTLANVGGVGTALGFDEEATLADVVTLVGYGLGLWWCVGGPTWAGLGSIACDEIDGRLARAMGTASKHGAELDWGADVILTPLALRRLGAALKHPNLALVAAPPILYAQANLRAEGRRPTFGSARAAIMVGAMILERALG